ncbi:MAG: hypothetical protein ABH811_00660 [archaeon]
MKERGINYLIVFIVISVAVLGLFFLNKGLTGFVVFNQDDQTEFDLGIYTNTEWNGSAVVLSENNLSGTYISKVFDAEADAVWNNLMKVQNTPNVESFYVVDGGGDIYQSTDFGVNWAISQENFGRTTATEDMFSNSNYLYILSNSGNEVWRSVDGTSFSVVNNSFSASPLIGESDSNGNLFVATAPGTLYKSTDNGITWEEIGDCNNDATNNPKGIAINSTDDMFVVDGAGDVYSSIDAGVTWTKVNDGYGGSTGTDGLSVDSDNYLYILLGSGIYQSTDAGATWSKINDDFSPYSNEGFEIIINENNIFVADGAGRIFKSINSGVDLVELGDFNGGASTTPLGLTFFTQKTNLSFQVRNCSSSDCSDGSWQDVDLSNVDLTGRYFQYRVNFTSPDSGTTPVLISVSIDYDLINQAPTISLVSPQNGTTYGYNESIPLKFVTSDVDGNIDSCWYNIDGGDNVKLNDCANTTFDVAGNEDYTLTIYVNDTQGEEASDSASFSVQIGAPTIELTSPIDSYLNDNNIIFRYVPTDLDLNSCELLGDFTGSFVSNQTDVNPTSGSENIFSLSLADGVYLWNIKCNDSQGNIAMNGNKTFYVDTTNPILTLIEPTGSKSSRLISLEWNVSDNNLNSCLYNVYRGENIEVANTSVSCSSDLASFSVTVDANFVLNFYVNDLAGNSVFDSSNFTVSTSLGGTTVVSGGSGGGGGSSTTIITQNGTTKLNVGEIQNLLVEPKYVKKIKWGVKNTGTNFLNDCKVKGEGNYASWVSSDEIKDLAAGEEHDFVFNLNVPENVVTSKYDLIVLLDCQEISEASSFVAEIIEKKLNFELIKVERESNDQVKIIYSIEELSNVEQKVELQFLLFDSNNEKSIESKETKTISAGSKEDFETFILIDSSLEGDLSLLVNLNSETYSTFVQENIVLGSPISGFAVFGNASSTDGVISIGLIALFLVFVFFVIRRILKHKKKKK